MTTEYHKVLWEGRSGPNGSLQRPQHAWIANDGEGGEPVFKSYGMQGFRTTKLMRARCSCGDAGPIMRLAHRKCCGNRTVLLPLNMK